MKTLRYLLIAILLVAIPAYAAQVLLKSIKTNNNNRLLVSTGGVAGEASAITASRALVSNASGIPVASAISTTTLEAMLSGSVGGTDNTVPRSDGLGGFTLQGSLVEIDDDGIVRAPYFRTDGGLLLQGLNVSNNGGGNQNIIFSNGPSGPSMAFSDNAGYSGWTVFAEFKTSELSVPTLRVQGVSGQTSDAFQVYNFAGDKRMWIEVNGTIRSLGDVYFSTLFSTNVYLNPNNVNSGLQFIGRNGTSYSLGTVSVKSNVAGSVAFAVQGETSQTGNLQNWTDSSEVVLASVTAGGAVKPKGVTADPCGDTTKFPQDSLWMNATSHYLCTCVGGADKKAADGVLDCF